MNKTKIVCTMGPACNDLETIKNMIRAGMSVARFNMSHGTHDSHRQQINLVKQARWELNMPVSIMLDTKGPEIRIRQFKNGKVNLKVGQSFALTTESLVGDEEIVSVTYQKLPSIVKKGTKILLNDGLIELEVESKTATVIYTKVTVGGELSNNKSINIPSVELNMPYLNDVDKSDLKFGAEEEVDLYSISFVNSASDVTAVREFLERECDVDSPFIISKIESARGVDNMLEIIDASDGIMVARGDMGVEIPFEKLPHIQKDMLLAAMDRGKYTITATQMLESMITNVRPTRAEISDVANAIYDGTSAIMLSGETSVGKDPVNVISTMRKIAEEAEFTIDYTHSLANVSEKGSVTSGVGYASCALASSLSAKAILVSTNTGASAACISGFRPGSEIVALTPNIRAYFKLVALWGVSPIIDEIHSSTDEMLMAARKKAKEAGFVQKGDLVIQTAGVVTGGKGSDLLVVSEIK